MSLNYEDKIICLSATKGPCNEPVLIDAHRFVLDEQVHDAFKETECLIFRESHEIRIRCIKGDVYHERPNEKEKQKLEVGESQQLKEYDIIEINSFEYVLLVQENTKPLENKNAQSGIENDNTNTSQIQLENTHPENNNNNNNNENLKWDDDNIENKLSKSENDNNNNNDNLKWDDDDMEIKSSKSKSAKLSIPNMRNNNKSKCDDILRRQSLPKERRQKLTFKVTKPKWTDCPTCEEDIKISFHVAVSLARKKHQYRHPYRYNLNPRSNKFNSVITDPIERGRHRDNRGRGRNSDKYDHESPKSRSKTQSRSRSRDSRRR